MNKSQSHPEDSSHQVDYLRGGLGSNSMDDQTGRRHIEQTRLASARREVPDIDEEVSFIPPAEGTPAAEALAANAAIKVSKVTKGFQRKWRGMKRPKMKNLNIVRKIRKHTKKKQPFSRNFKGKVIDGLHELYTLTIGMMLGLRCTVGRTVTEEEQLRQLTLDDFNYVEKRTFRPGGTTKSQYRTPPHSLGHTFKFKSYAPLVFRRLREFMGVDTVSYMLSVCGNCNFLEFMSNSKSGQFFFYSHDGKYMIKTQTKEENKFMKRILPFYYQFMIENPHTHMVRFLGMHRVKMYHLRRKVHFVIMSSVFDTPVQIHTIYDLKGSRIGREATEKERKSGGVLKDNDLVNDGTKLHLGPKREAFIEQLRRDAEFLAKLNIMDYSLLVGVHDRKKRVFESEAAASSANLTQLHSHSNTPFRTRDEGLPRVVSTDSAMSRSISVRKKAPGGRPNDEPAALMSKLTLQVDDGDLRVPPSGVSYSHFRDEDGVEHTILEEEDESNEDEEDIDSDESDYDDESEATDSVINEVDKAIFSATTKNLDQLVGKDEIGKGARGKEGAPVSKLFRKVDPLGAMAGDGGQKDPLLRQLGAILAASPDAGALFGLGQAQNKPWSNRSDGGINSRVGEERGDEIYFLGIIDILQQYNMHKRSETFVKSFTHDPLLISSVDPEFYAVRFVDFIADNTD